MTFAESIKTCFAKYTDFTGRASRSEYWWFFLFNLLLMIGLSLLNENIATVYVLATTLPGLAVNARRLHDTNRSGWWQLILLIPIVGLVILFFFAQEGKVVEEQTVEQNQEAAPEAKKKVGWTGTILWMLGMLLAFNVVAGIIVYFLMKK
ncbi:MAG: DUF805 domain-containing protein [Nitrosomonadales bacterium]|nr:DUF805 domain-containing protein [Nitrosomonadales bacterium]